MKRSDVAAYCVLAFVSALWVLGYSALFGPLVYPFAPDGAFYIESARNFVSGNGYVVTPDAHDTAHERVPLRLWPPGFPTAIGVVSLLDVPAEDAAVAIVRIAWLLLPLALVFALSRLVGVVAAAVVAILVTLAPGVSEHGYLAASDIPFLVLVVLALGLLIRSALRDSDTLYPWLLSGVLAGVAYDVRNAGLAVFAAVAAGFVAAAWLRLWDRRTLLLRAAAWGLGATMTAAPVLIRNWAVFGKLQPYDMPPSTVGWVLNTRAYLDGQLLDLSAMPAVANIAWDVRWIALLLLPIAAAFAWGLVRRWRSADAGVRFTMLLLMLYVAAGTAMVVLSRTVYEWGEAIGPHHAMQYSWAILALAAVVLAGGESSARRYAVAAAVAALLIARVGYVGQDYAREAGLGDRLVAVDRNISLAAAALPARESLSTRDVRNVIATDDALLARVRAFEPDAFVVSNRDEVLVIETGQRVRRIPVHDVDALVRELERLRRAVPRQRALYAVITIDPALLRAHGAQALNLLAAGLQASFRIVDRNPNWIIFAGR
jgi:hypothetical protein